MKKLCSLMSAIMMGCLSASAINPVLVVSVENSIADRGHSGTFDITLTSPATFNISSFTFEVTLAPGTGVNFTGADGNTTSTSYIFGTVQVPSFFDNNYPNTDTKGGDVDLSDNFFVTLTPGETVGLGHITYSVAPDADPGMLPFNAVSIGPITGLADDSGNALPFLIQNGTITVLPEPSTLALWGLAGVMGIAARQRLRRSSR